MGVGASLARGRVEGQQAATAFNFAGGGVRGAQLAAGANIATGPVFGAQLSAGVNVATKRVDGVQATAGVNLAPAGLDGAQLSAVNVAGDVIGAQVGVVNIGRRVKGLQLGVLNIAQEVDGAAIGLVTITKDSIHPIAWASNLAFSNAGIKFTTKYVYTLAGIGFGTRETDFDGGPVVTTALGVHLPLFHRFDVDAEVAYTSVDLASQTNHALHPRVIAGYAFSRHFRLFAGGGPRVPVSFARGSSAVRPEVVAGVQF